MKYLLISFSLIFLLACSNNEVKLNTSNSIFISPDNIELSNYSGELIYFQVTNNSKHTIYLTPDISLFTRYNDKEYIVQKKNKFSIHRRYLLYSSFHIQSIYRKKLSCPYQV